MKKLLVLLLMLAMAFALASCDVQATVDKLLGKEEHTHAYEMISTDATCTEGGTGTFACSCGESYTEQVEALGHDMQVKSSVPVTCTTAGYNRMRCSRCSVSESVKIEATGHAWGEAVEASRMILCTNAGCSVGHYEETNGKYTEVLVFKYTEEEKEALFATIDALKAEIEALPEYNAADHAFAEEGELAEAYAEFEVRYFEMEDALYYAMEQRQIAEIMYYCDNRNEELKATYDAMSEFYTEAVGRFFALPQAMYDSMYREFAFEGMTEEEIKMYLEDSADYSDPEYIALKTQRDRIESEFYELSAGSSAVIPLYAEFVEVNKAIAEHFGYDNYLEYAYASVYDRDYSYDSVEVIYDYVKEYIAPVFAKLSGEASALKDTTSEYPSVGKESFFENAIGNAALNDYIDLLEFDSNNDKLISFSDEFNNLIGDGNMFRGTYRGAFVTYIYPLDLPIAYFGQGYDNTFTVAHEFGHYMNEIYNRSEFSQSYDLLEMHSQGNEMLYLSYLKNCLSPSGHAYTEASELANMFEIILLATSIDMFERAVYTNTYTGTNADVIMADNVIDSSEYDTLYAGICTDVGLARVYSVTSLLSYWRQVTIPSPCYYISYAISALSVVQLYPLANEDFDAAVDAYLKLFTYTDTYVGEEYEEMTTAEILEYAGLYSFTDEELYKYLYETLM